MDMLFSDLIRAISVSESKARIRKMKEQMLKEQEEQKDEQAEHDED
jgi:hypothetical protein